MEDLIYLQEMLKNATSVHMAEELEKEIVELEKEQQQ